MQAEIVNRDGARRNVPRRSSRLQGLSAIYRQAEEKSRTQPPKSFTTLEMHAIALIEGNIYDKEHFLDVEDDSDNIDQFVAETPHDKMFTDAVNFNEQDANLNPDHEQSHEPRSREKIKEILDSINDLELRNHLEKWIYQYTSVFNDQLNNEPAAVAPFK